MTRLVTDPKSYLYRTNVDLRKAVITKTGPWEVTVKVPLDVLITAVFRLGDTNMVIPKESAAADMTKWQNCFGTGPYMVNDSVPGSQVIMVRNPDYWMKNPIGPGKGDQLPYIERIKYIILPDASTRQAALRTAKTDTAGGYSIDDAAAMRRHVPVLKEAQSEPVFSGAPESIDFPCDKAPYTDIRVRRALFLATDLNAINNGLYQGKGQILSWPFPKIAGYEDLYLGLDDPEMPASVKELYTYNPDKAKQLLKEAGFPNGFKTSALATSGQVDFYSVVKDMWAKVGVELVIDVKDSAVKNTILNSGEWNAIADGGCASVSAWHTCPTLTGVPSAPANTSRIFYSKIDQALRDIRKTILTSGMKAGMKQMKELLKYALDQAYAVPVPYVSPTTFWWPWLKNYSGEVSVGYYDGPNYIQFLWIDQALKKSMGY